MFFSVGQFDLSGKSLRIKERHVARFFLRLAEMSHFYSMQVQGLPSRDSFITSWPRLPITQALGSFNRSAHRVQRCKRASSAQSVWLRTQKTETSRNGFIEWVRHQVQKERKDQFSAIFHQSPSGGGGPARFTCFLSSALSEGLTNHFRRSHSSYPHSDLPSPALWRWTRHLPRET